MMVSETNHSETLYFGIHCSPLLYQSMYLSQDHSPKPIFALFFTVKKKTLSMFVDMLPVSNHSNVALWNRLAKAP